jgi:hypothetical protein
MQPTRSKGPLAVVQPGARAPRPPKPLTVTAAATTGDHHDLLVALRTRIAAAIDNPNTPAQALAALARQIREIDAALNEIDRPARTDEVSIAAATPDEQWATT